MEPVRPGWRLWSRTSRCGTEVSFWQPQRCRSRWAYSATRALPTHLNSKHDLRALSLDRPREPGLSRRAASIAQVGQKAPVRVRHARLPQPLHVLLGREVVQLQALDLAPKP